MTSLQMLSKIMTFQLSKSQIAEYHEKGYLIIPQFFTSGDIEELKASMDQWHAECLSHPSTYRHKNKVMWLKEHETVGKFVQGMQWPSYDDAIMQKFRTDPRWLSILSPLIGNDVKQIINQLHWKTPETGMVWPLHRDVRSRRPPENFRNLLWSYVQTGIAVDDHTPENGCMKIVPGSHRQNFKWPDDHEHESWVIDGELAAAELVEIEMKAGDVALWSPYTIHGGGTNTTKDSFRRLYINGYVKAQDCDLGEWAFRDGQPCDLGEPQVVQYLDLHKNPEPHYPTHTQVSD
jgi:ectoine hydroxylase-related dioxygenase (phytanoyl-CoA dioxygenase family)